MSNPYFTHVSKYVPGTLAKGNEVNADFVSVNTGFDGAYTDIKRAIKMPTSITADQVLPELVADRANLFIGFDAAGDISVGTPTSISSPVLAPSNAYQIARANIAGAAWEFESGLLHSPTNVLFAPGAGASLTGTDNTLLGPGAGAALTTGTGNVFIGHDAGATLTTTSNVLIIANTNTVTPLIYGDFANGRVGIGRVPTTYAWELEGSAHIRGGNIAIGQNDAVQGILQIFGQGASFAQGGDCRVYTSADHDTTIQYWAFAAYQDDARIYSSDGAVAHYFRNDGSVEFANKVTFYGDALFYASKISTSPIINFDSGDYLYYDRSGNTVNLVVGAAVQGSWGAGNISVGVNDTTKGSLYLYGDSATGGGTLRIYNGGTADGTIDYWSFAGGSSGNLDISSSAGLLGIISTAGALNWRQGTVGVGVDDTTQGSLYLYGDSNVAGGELRIYNAANEDGYVDYWSISADGTGTSSVLDVYSDSVKTVSIGRTAALMYMTIPGANTFGSKLTLGTYQTYSGSLALNGDSGTNSPSITFYNAASLSTLATTVEVSANSDTLGIRASGGTSTNTKVDVGFNTLYSGTVRVAGDNGSVGGTLLLYNGDTADTTVDYWDLYANDQIELRAAGVTKLYMANDYGLVIGSPTGGSKGAGTVNVTGAYRNGKWIPPVHTGSFTTGGIAKGATASQTITHGLGTDNVMVTLMGLGSVSERWDVTVTRPDGALVRYAGYGGVTSFTLSATPSTGDVVFDIYNNDTAGAQTVTVNYMIFAAA